MVSCLLSLNKASLKPTATTFFFFAACLILSALSSSASFQPSRTLLSRPLNKLRRPVVILISCDGFRFGYQHKTPTPNIKRLIDQGTEAETGLIPVFPTLTFPNHNSIATGLYPAYHGIVSNSFTDPNTGDGFTQKIFNPKWWLGEPLWETVVNQGLNAATYSWPGAEVNKGSWTCPKQFCSPFNESVPFEDRIDTILSYFDLPTSEIPALVTLYLEDPDAQGHEVGPDHPRITDAVARIDKLLGRMIAGLEKRRVFKDVHVILVGDHGMVGTCDQRLIFLKELAPWINIPENWIERYTPLLSIRPPPNVSAADIVAKINEGLESGKVGNGKYLKVYLKENLPSRLHYSDSDRITPIVGLAAEGFKVEMNKTEAKECAGAHGYDNAFFSMRSIFIGHGPRFPKGVKVPSFENIQIYNLVTSILNLHGARNNGTSSFPKAVLLPRYNKNVLVS
ncbi:Ectonucleotide pyrophosphatase/phosphodiesterase family member 3 [Heracleum sosnowskyi]|uniref:Ectonucleotide pyrophosphatase/phosphodiesterase family member 3 n=1 Tax=Heracleum sosnowskyi TaxID=360622 RepID=A0AAD8LY60_9APIA|nr:Ectonucleotide pyrophosphatase/phosphodiesterase family member 3 [Heracleum sosnowskyi]